MTGIGLLAYYEAIGRASDEMLAAAQTGDWDRVMRLEGACAVLISQLKHAAHGQSQLNAEQSREKRRIMQRILANDAKVRQLAEPWLDDLDRLMAAAPRALH
nr:flagellar protein FliT [Caldimonas tepidiphila]